MPPLPPPVSSSAQRTGLLSLLLMLCLLLCGTVAVAQDMPLAIELRQLLLESPPLDDSSLNWDELNTFYTAEHFQPVWLGLSGPNRRATLLRERLQQARNEGLVPQRYHTELIESLWYAKGLHDRLHLELLLSSAFFDYARDVRGGRIEPEQVAPLWKIDTVPVDPVTMLRLSLLVDDFNTVLDSLPPKHPVYRRLRQALDSYRLIESAGGWPIIPEGPPLSVGMRDPRVALLRKRLQLEGDLSFPGVAADEFFDKGLSYAVERFQVRYGLQVDGVVGKETLAELNTSVAVRIEQIIFNMERWRWLPQYLGRRYLIVNIPAYQLIAYEDDQARLSMPVIIGTRERPTPMATGLLQTVVLNPYWTVPRTIALRDLIPRQQRNPDYMPSYHIRVFSDWNGEHELDPRQIDWSEVNWNNFPYMLRQDPGPKNPLGRAKFLFNNPFNVYLHDTPNDALFAESVRAYSSGCIRVEEPLRLATFLLEGDKGWDWSEKMVQEVIDTGLTYKLSLASPLPVYLLYLTVWVGEDGAVHFSRDIYGEDAMLAVCMPAGEPSS